MLHENANISLGTSYYSITPENIETSFQLVNAILRVTHEETQDML